MSANARPEAQGGGPDLAWGLIGASTIAREWVLPAIDNVDGHTAVAVASTSRERAEDFAEANGVPRAYGEVNKLLADRAVDAVYISTTNELHAEQAMSAAQAGKHVLCEKPIALRVDDAAAMVKACADAGVVLATNHHFRNGAWVPVVRDLVTSGELGEVVSARISQAFSLPAGLRTWRLQDRARGAGAILDLTPHDVDTLRAVLGLEVEAVSAVALHSGLAGPPIEDGAVGVMRLTSGVAVSFFDSFCVDSPSSDLEIFGTDASVLVVDALSEDLRATAFLVRDGARQGIEIPEPVDLYEVGIRRFGEAVAGRGAPAASGVDGLRSLAVALAAIESAQTGAWVDLESAESETG